jgi:hypothetical protein
MCTVQWIPYISVLPVSCNKRLNLQSYKLNVKILKLGKLNKIECSWVEFGVPVAIITLLLRMSLAMCF